MRFGAVEARLFHKQEVGGAIPPNAPISTIDFPYLVFKLTKSQPWEPYCKKDIDIKKKYFYH